MNRLQESFKNEVTHILNGQEYFNNIIVSRFFFLDGTTLMNTSKRTQ